MKNNKKLALAAATFGIAALAMGGSTFAWFQVVNTANVAVQGTIVGVDSRLEVGFRTTNAVTGAAALGLVEDAVFAAGDGFFYWAPNSINSTVMDAVIAANGFGTSDELNPITSGSFVANDALGTFYDKPVFNANRTNPIAPLTGDTAELTDYVGFTMVFRALDENDTPINSVPIKFDIGTALSAEEVSYLGDDGITTVTVDPTDALRIAFDNGTQRDIIKPTAISSGVIDVGGPMDLNGDGVFDHTLQTYTDSVPNDMFEIAYGEFTTTLNAPSDLDHTEWDDVAGTAFAEQYSNNEFYEGATANGVFGLDSVAAVPATASFNTIAAYTGAGSAIATTAGAGVAEVDFRIWLEGWDHAAVNAVSNAAYAATLTFIATLPA